MSRSETVHLAMRNRDGSQAPTTACGQWTYRSKTMQATLTHAEVSCGSCLRKFPTDPHAAAANVS